MDVDDRLNEHLARIKKLEERLDGNGRPGIAERLSALERGVAMTNRMLLAVFSVCIGILFRVLAHST